MSVFHRVDQPLDLPSSRFFRMAQRLPLRGGAVTAALSAVRAQVESAPDVIAQPPVTSSTALDVDDSAQIAALAARSQNPGFPGIGYSGG